MHVAGSKRVGRLSVLLSERMLIAGNLSKERRDGYTRWLVDAIPVNDGCGNSVTVYYSTSHKVARQRASR